MLLDLCSVHAVPFLFECFRGASMMNIPFVSVYSIKTPESGLPVYVSVNYIHSVLESLLFASLPSHC
jgi:hypothetical protein